MKTEIIPAYEDIEEIKKLLMEYTELLIEGNPEIVKYLKIQNYESEFEHLEIKYGLPEGRLFIAKISNEVAGCIALRKIDDVNCEMKRLYVKPAFRGNKIAERLVETIIEEAQKIGYKSILLDTLPFLKGAVCLYKKMGFYEIESYNNSPINNTIYMKLDLT